VQCSGYQPDEARASLALVQQLPRPTATPAQDTTPDPNAPPPAPITVDQIEFQLLTSNDPTLADLGSAITAAWTAVGIKATLTVVDKVTFRERLAAGGFDAALVELNLEPLSDPDPYSLWRQEPAAGGLNFGGLNERRLSELMENARREPNGIARAELYRQFQALFCERAAAIPLFYPAYFYGVDRRLSGVQIGFVSDPSDRFRTIQDWRYSES
jgi:ABC-type transport system substrate-binding protein